MKTILVFLFLLQSSIGDKYLCSNVTEDATVRQLKEFKLEHPKPIGLWTENEGEPVEVRDTITLNSDLALKKLFFEIQAHLDGERIPQRLVHAKGVAVWGYFEVTNDVSKYTKAKVFNGIGKKTKVLVRFSNAAQERGGSDVSREVKGLAAKFYTEDGNLDLLTITTPIFGLKDPLYFMTLAHATTQKSRSAGMVTDPTAFLDAVTLRAEMLYQTLYLLSDFGIPNGYRKMDTFAVHTFVVNNDKGERHYVRFNLRTEQGVDFLTDEQAAAIQATDLDYYNRDLYNAIHNGDFPSWKLEMDILSEHDILNVGYDPFDVTWLWKNGTYHTETIGRLVLNKNSDNSFRDSEQSAFAPDRLVPGIPGPVDQLFKGRSFSYMDTQNHRISRNHDLTLINSALYTKTYNRDGFPPVKENMKDAPAYYPNSFNGPIPYVDETRPIKQLQVLESNAVDLQPVADFYNKIVATEAAKLRLAGNFARSVDGADPKVLERAVKLLYLIDSDLGLKVEEALLARQTCRK